MIKVCLCREHFCLQKWRNIQYAAVGVNLSSHILEDPLITTLIMSTKSMNWYHQSRWNTFNHYDSDLSFAFGAFARKNFNHWLAAELDWNYQNLEGSPTKKRAGDTPEPRAEQPGDIPEPRADRPPRNSVPSNQLRKFFWPWGRRTLKIVPPSLCFRPFRPT